MMIYSFFDNTHNCPANQFGNYNTNTAVLDIYKSVLLMPVL